MVVDEVEIVETVKNEFQLYHFDHIEPILQSLLGIKDPLGIVFADRSLEFFGYFGIKVIQNNISLNFCLHFLHHQQIFLPGRHISADPIDQGQRQLVKPNSAVAVFVFSVLYKFLIPNVKDHVQLNSQNLLSLLLQTLKMLIQLHFPLKSCLLKFLTAEVLVLCLEDLGNMHLMLMRQHLFPVLTVHLQIFFNPIEANLLIEQILILANLNELFFLLLPLLLTLTHTKQHFLYIWIHLLVQSAFHLLKSRQVVHNQLQK